MRSTTRSRRRAREVVRVHGFDARERRLLFHRLGWRPVHTGKKSQCTPLLVAVGPSASAKVRRFFGPAAIRAEAGSVWRASE